MDLKIGSMVLCQALFDFLVFRKLLDLKEVVGASGFEPPTSWSRTITNLIR